MWDLLMRLVRHAAPIVARMRPQAISPDSTPTLEPVPDEGVSKPAATVATVSGYDRAAWFAMYRERFGALTQSQVTGIEFLLGQIEADSHIADLRHAAYMMATVYHETSRTFEPIDEHGSESYFERRYGPQTQVGRRLGNTRPGDGARYHGRGYVQLTGRANYRRMTDALRREFGLTPDLEAQPDVVKEPLTAYRIMSAGMGRGLFTGRKLRHYIDGATCDYANARRIINGTDQAAKIARYAESFEACFRRSAR